MTDEAVWKAIDALRDQSATLAEGLAVVRHEQAVQRERDARMLEMLAEMRGEMRGISRELHEARGGLKLGRWLAGVAATLSGAAVALWVFLTNGGGQ